MVKQAITPAGTVMPISRNDNSVNATAFSTDRTTMARVLPTAHPLFASGRG